jgi:hypothetical protein
MLLLEEKFGDAHTGDYHNGIGEETFVLVAGDQKLRITRRDWDAGEDHT